MLVVLTDNEKLIRPAGSDPVRTLTVVPFRRRLSRRGPGAPGQRDSVPARAIGGPIEKRVDLAREGGGRRAVADDVGERGPPGGAGSSAGPSLP